MHGLYVPTKCSSNNIEMAEDDHVPDNTKCMDLTEDIEAAQCVIMGNVVISSQTGLDLRPFLKYVAIHYIARTVIIYFYHLSLARPSFVLVSPAQLVWFHFGGKACARSSLALAADTWPKLKIQPSIFCDFIPLLQMSNYSLSSLSESIFSVNLSHCIHQSCVLQYEI